jgi:hypothetical protein
LKDLLESLDSRTFPVPRAGDVAGASLETVVYVGRSWDRLCSSGDARSMADDEGLEKDMADIEFSQAESEIYENRGREEHYNS